MAEGIPEGDARSFLVKVANMRLPGEDADAYPVLEDLIRTARETVGRLYGKSLAGNPRLHLALMFVVETANIRLPFEDEDAGDIKVSPGNSPAILEMLIGKAQETVSLEAKPGGLVSEAARQRYLSSRRGLLRERGSGPGAEGDGS